MSKGTTIATNIQTPAELLQEICAPHILPDESSETFDSLREALFSDLAPRTPYETLLAEQLVTLEWDGLRHRRMRDSLLRSEFRDLAHGAVNSGQVRKRLGFEIRHGLENEGFDLVSDDPERRDAAQNKIDEAQIPRAEIMAKAYQSLAKDLEPHERQISELEIRRRKLRADYEALTAKRASAPIEDAEEVAP